MLMHNEKDEMVRVVTNRPQLQPDHVLQGSVTKMQKQESVFIH